jgi:hypothetical protein
MTECRFMLPAAPLHFADYIGAVWNPVAHELTIVRTEGAEKPKFSAIESRCIAA